MVKITIFILTEKGREISKQKRINNRKKFLKLNENMRIEAENEKKKGIKKSETVESEKRTQRRK